MNVLGHSSAFPVECRITKPKMLSKSKPPVYTVSAIDSFEESRNTHHDNIYMTPTRFNDPNDASANEKVNFHCGFCTTELEFKTHTCNPNFLTSGCEIEPRGSVKIFFVYVFPNKNEPNYDNTFNAYSSDSHPNLQMCSEYHYPNVPPNDMHTLMRNAAQSVKPFQGCDTNPTTTSEVYSNLQTDNCEISETKILDAFSNENCRPHSENNSLEKPGCIVELTVDGQEMPTEDSKTLLVNDYEKKTFRCDICTKYFSSEDRLNEHKVHHKDSPQCEFCLRLFSTESSLKKHKCQPNNQVFSCNICGVVLGSSRSLRHHTKKHSTPQSYNCKLCDAQFSWQCLLRSHLKQMHGGKRNRPPQTDRNLACEFCGKSFKFPVLLNMHRRKHTGEKPFQCSICPKSFTQKESLEGHERMHRGEKPFQCEVCGKRFSYGSTFYTHKSTHKLSTDDLKCNTCGMVFKSKESLIRHVRRHKRDPSYSCSFCGREFIDKSTLKNHIKLHDVKPFRCRVCSKGFYRQEELDEHELYHTVKQPFVCNICGKGFPDKQLLASHEKCHSKEKPYECDLCGKRYTWRSSLMYHRRGHDNYKAPSDGEEK